MGKPNLSSPAPRRTTAIFAKRPVPGCVKTRLAPTLDPYRAAQLARVMLEDLVERLTACDGFCTVLCFAPAEDRAWFAESLPAVRDLRPQVGPGLAERLEHFFRQELTGTVGSSAVAVGSDVPLLSNRVVVEAHEALRAGADLVLGPDPGGGYYLIGLREPHASLFTEVEMSTADMRGRTLDEARRLGLEVLELEPLYDVDLGADLERLRRDLAGLRTDDERFPGRTASFLERLDAEDT